MPYLRGAFVAFLMTHAGVCVAASCTEGVRPNGEVIEFSGILHSDEQWGPPNFGENPETDSKFTAWIISVNPPIPIKGGVRFGEETWNTATKIQISIGTMGLDRKFLAPLDGKMVVATGNLWDATAPADVTPVVLSLAKLETTDKSICRVLSPAL